MEHQIASCPCGQKLKVAAGAASVRCPTCSKVLKLRPAQSRADVQSTASGQSATRSGSASPTALKCPCGQVVRLTADEHQVTCNQCGTTLRRKTPPTTRRPGQSDTSRLSTTATLPASQASPRSRPINPRSKTNVGQRHRADARKGAREDRPARFPSWLLPVGLGIGSLCLLGLVAAIVFPRFLGAEVAGDDSNAGTTDAPVAESDMVRIATYPPGPRLPSTTEFLPRDFVDSLSFPIGQYIRDIPPEQNGAPELLDALKVLTAELAICFPEPEQNEIARVGAINEANIELWHDEYTMTGKLPTPEQLTPFDPSFRKLVDITRSKELRFYSIHDIELPLPELKVLRLVTRLCHLRARALRDQIPIRQRIDEFRAVLRICRELGHRKVADEFLSFMAIDFAFSTSFRALLFDADLDADASRALVEVITNDLRQFEKSQLVQMARSEQLLFYRFLSRVQKTSDAHESLLEAINFFVARGQQNLEMEQRDALMTNQLATITPEQLQMNRNAFDAELQHFLQFVQADTGDWWARVQAYQTEEQQRLKTVYSGMGDAMNSGNLNGHPWLAAFIRPPGVAALFYQSYVGASERVALGELAQRISNLDGQPDSLTLSEAMNRLDLSDFRLDPFSGQVLTTVQRDGRRVVYSIGADGRDDQAISLSVGNSPGDIFFASENRESEQP